MKDERKKLRNDVSKILILLKNERKRERKLQER